MTNLSKLRDEHAVILRIVQRLDYLISGSTPPPRLHLLAVRHQLASTLIGHLKDEDWLLYPQLLASPDERIASTARAFSDELGGLAAAYRAHSDRWGADAIAADWDGYRTDCRELLDALTTRIAREDRELYPLVEARARAA